MKKSFILITLIAVLTASVALACAADNPECTYPGPTEWAVIEGYTVHYQCTIHVDCSVTERWGFFGWRCPAEDCHYGQRAGEPAVLLSTSHETRVR